MRIKTTLRALCAGLIVLTAGMVHGQQVCIPCQQPGGIVYTDATPASQVSLPTLPGIEDTPLAETSEVVATTPHVRCLVSGSCGSGTICGADANGAYVLSNAHVWGTTIGKTVTVDCVTEGGARRTTGRIVMAGYSNQRMVDFAIAYVPGLKSERYMQLLKTEPTDQPFATTGSPRCVWPQVTKPFNDARNYGDGLITGSPDAIGGQSGSAIYNSNGQQIALLTWSINRRCAGQKTSLLYRVATQRDVTLADPRPDGLQEVQCGKLRPVTESGIFGEAPAVFAGQATEMGDETAEQKIRPVTENIIANMVGSAMEDLPIWYEPQSPKPEPEPEPEPEPQPPAPQPEDPDAKPCPPCDGTCMTVTDKERELIDFLRKQAQEQGIREKAIDWVAIIKLVMELINLIQSGRQ